jgi:hypothetical protein
MATASRKTAPEQAEGNHKPEVEGKAEHKPEHGHKDEHEHAETRPMVHRPEMPQRFFTGGATADEREAWIQANWQGEYDDSEVDTR